MPPISTLVAKTVARKSQAQAAQPPDGTQPEPVSTSRLVPVASGAPGAPPQDLPVANPQRGSLPPSMVLASDLSDSQRQFRTTFMRSAIFPYPAPTTGTGSDKIAQIQAQITANTTAAVTAQTTASEIAVKVAALNMDTIPEGQSFGKPLQTAMTPIGVVDTTRPGVAAQGGSFPPQIVGAAASIFTYTATASTSTVVISWSAFTLYYPDGTTVTVPSGSQTITGVSTGTYYFYPYTPTTPLGVLFAQVSGGVGTPAILYAPQSPTAAQVTNLQSVTALASGGIQVVMPSSGGGSGGGGGSGRCVRSTMLVESRDRGILPIGDCNVGDAIRSRDGEWTTIAAFKLVPHSQFVRFTIHSGESVQVTATHHITTADGRSVPALDVKLSDFLVARSGPATISSIEFVEDPKANKVVLTCEPIHTFYAGEVHPDVLVHNNVPVS
jgi:hypothetical protein